MANKLPRNFRVQPPDSPDPVLTISGLTQAQGGCVSPDALFIDSEWNGWIDPNTPILKEGSTADCYLVVERTFQGILVRVDNSGREWERSMEPPPPGMVQVEFPD